MQIRERNGRVEFLRATWDAEAKRSRQKLIKQDEFTDAEREQFEAWSAARQAEAEQSKKETHARFGAHYIESFAKVVEEGFEVDEPTRVLAALDRLNKALRKAGIKRPPRVKKV